MSESASTIEKPEAEEHTLTRRCAASLSRTAGEGRGERSTPDRKISTQAPLDDIDRRIIKATQAGLSLIPRPYHAVADAIGIPPEEVMARLKRMLKIGVIRRIGAVPNHYRLGYTANGMSVWNIPDEAAAEVGSRIGALEFVSHCYLRPRHLPMWPYNLFAMLHARSRGTVEDHVRAVAGMLGPLDLGHEVLYSTRILKKTGLRLVD